MSVIWRRNYSPNKAQAVPRHSSKEWEFHREKITALYCDYELPRVVSIMEETEGFVASVPQYKRKFRDWGITKYDKYSIKQLRYMYQEIISRFRQGKQDTAFKLNGQVVNSSKVERTLQRALDNEVLELTSGEKCSPCGISPFTPDESGGVKVALKSEKPYSQSPFSRALSVSPPPPESPPAPAYEPQPHLHHLQPTLHSHNPFIGDGSSSSNHNNAPPAPPYAGICHELTRYIHETHPYGDFFAVSVHPIPTTHNNTPTTSQPHQLLRITCTDCLEHDEITICVSPLSQSLSSEPNTVAMWSFLLDRFEKEHIFTAPHQYKVFNRMFPPSPSEATNTSTTSTSSTFTSNTMMAAATAPVKSFKNYRRKAQSIITHNHGVAVDEYGMFDDLGVPEGDTPRSSTDSRQDVLLVRCELLANSCAPNYRADAGSSSREAPPLSINDILQDSLWEGGV